MSLEHSRKATMIRQHEKRWAPSPRWLYGAWQEAAKKPLEPWHGIAPSNTLPSLILCEMEYDFHNKGGGGILRVNKLRIGSGIAVVDCLSHIFRSKIAKRISPPCSVLHLESYNDEPMILRDEENLKALLIGAAQNVSACKLLQGGLEVVWRRVELLIIRC